LYMCRPGRAPLPWAGSHVGPRRGLGAQGSLDVHRSPGPGSPTLGLVATSGPGVGCVHKVAWMSIGRPGRAPLPRGQVAASGPGVGCVHKVAWMSIGRPGRAPLPWASPGRNITSNPLPISYYLYR